jgi:hypothetical protein
VIKKKCVALLLSSFLTIYLSACSSNNNALYHNDFDFSAVKTYSMYSRNSEFSDTQSLTDTLRNSIEIAIENHMEKHDFFYNDAESSDLIVTYHVVDKTSDYKDYNKAVLFCQQCLIASNWQQGKDKFRLAKDSLIIDLIDPKRKRSVWRSIQPLKIKDKDNSIEVNEKIYQAVYDMLIQYPKFKPQR